jgi:hypothetical protein
MRTCSMRANLLRAALHCILGILRKLRLRPTSSEVGLLGRNDAGSEGDSGEEGGY